MCRNMDCTINDQTISYQVSPQYLLSITNFMDSSRKVSGKPIDHERLPSRTQNTRMVTALEEFFFLDGHNRGPEASSRARQT